MITMQYGFNLPADYDMQIIRRRIAEKGPLLDGFPQLAFKAYLYAARDHALLPAQQNRYAPFYLWQGDSGLQTFLGGEVFAQVAQNFGRPATHCAFAWEAQWRGDLRHAVCATIEHFPIAPDARQLEASRDVESAKAWLDLAAGALATVTAFDPATWQVQRFRLWPEPRLDLRSDTRELYAVGYVALPSAD